MYSNYYRCYNQAQLMNKASLMVAADDKCQNILILLRQIIRAIDLHSKHLVRLYGLTGPQMLLLKLICEASESSPPTSRELADLASLSQATITSILDRLDANGYAVRERSTHDRRKIYIKPTDKSIHIFASRPELLQEQFVLRFNQLKNWEKTSMLAMLERMVDMMSAEDLDAAPMLSSGELG